jgi:hypothetical protein
MQSVKRAYIRETNTGGKKGSTDEAAAHALGQPAVWPAAPSAPSPAFLSYVSGAGIRAHNVVAEVQQGKARDLKWVDRDAAQRDRDRAHRRALNDGHHVERAVGLLHGRATDKERFQALARRIARSDADQGSEEHGHRQNHDTDRKNEAVSTLLLVMCAAVEVVPGLYKGQREKER